MQLRRASWVILFKSIRRSSQQSKKNPNKTQKPQNKTTPKQTKNNLTQSQCKNVGYRRKRACSSFISLFILFRSCVLNIVHLHMLAGCSESLRSFQPLVFLCTRVKIIKVLIILFYRPFSR